MRSVVLITGVLALGGLGGVACGDAPIDGPLESGGDLSLPDRVKTEAPDAGPSGSGKTTTDAGTTKTTVTLTVTLSGSGTGLVASMPGSVTCTGTTCKGTFARGTMVSLTVAPAGGAVFAGWSGGCTGSAACAIKMDADTAVTADLESLDGTWSGSYTNSRPANGCTFNNAGTLTVTGTATGGALSQSANITGLQLRQSGCQVVGSTTGSAPSAAVAATGGTITGSWTFNVAQVGGTLAFPFTAKVTGKTMTGTWTCPSCTGSFTLTKP
jgi:hypothetical protein